MKLLFENWKKYLNEGTQYDVVTFDFDDTLTITRPDDDYGVVEVGPNDEMITTLKSYVDRGIEVYIVTSRLEGSSNPDRSTPEQYVSLFNLKLAGPPIYTNGELKAKTLVKLGSELHYDDDIEEIMACKDAGIKTFKVPVPYWEAVGIDEQYDMFINKVLNERQFIKKALRYLFKDE